MELGSDASETEIEEKVQSILSEIEQEKIKYGNRNIKAIKGIRRFVEKAKLERSKISDNESNFQELFKNQQVMASDSKIKKRFVICIDPYFNSFMDKFGDVNYLQHIYLHVPDSDVYKLTNSTSYQDQLMEFNQNSRISKNLNSVNNSLILDYYDYSIFIKRFKETLRPEYLDCLSTKQMDIIQDMISEGFEKQYPNCLDLYKLYSEYKKPTPSELFFDGFVRKIDLVEYNSSILFVKSGDDTGIKNLIKYQLNNAKCPIFYFNKNETGEEIDFENQFITKKNSFQEMVNELCGDKRDKMKPVNFLIVVSNLSEELIFPCIEEGNPITITEKYGSTLVTEPQVNICLPVNSYDKDIIEPIIK